MVSFKLALAFPCFLRALLGESPLVIQLTDLSAYYACNISVNTQLIDCLQPIGINF